MSTSRSQRDQNAISRQSAAKEQASQSRASNKSNNRSPLPPISTTPSADRQLLRTLTGSPEGLGNDEVTNLQPPSQSGSQTGYQSGTGYDSQTGYASQTGSQTTTQNQPTTSRTGEGHSRSQHSTPYDWDTLQADQSSRSRQSQSHHSRQSQSHHSVSYAGSPNKPGRQSASGVIDIPATPSDVKTDDWQSGKTVAQTNGYMLKYEVACDVTFFIGTAKEEVRAHKYMLLSRSPIFFKTLVKHLGNSDVKISLPDIKADTFRDLLQYIYTDEFDIHTDNVASMLYAAKKFQLKGLADMCFRFLDAEMQADTVFKIMEQAHIYNETTLYEKCTRFIFANGNEVMKKPNISELCEDCITRIIKSDELRAKEESVFEGCMTWANAQCRQQRKQPSDENRRLVLGPALYLIRFPVMEKTYFTQKVSLGKLLTHDETLSIYQYFHGEEQNLPNNFNKNERHHYPKTILTENSKPMVLASERSGNANLMRIKRFSTTEGLWKQNGPPDAISFTVSQPIILHGLLIFGTARGSETYFIKLLVYDDINRQEVRSTDCNVQTNSIQNTYEMHLSRPLRIPPRRAFTALVQMKGNPTCKGVGGQKAFMVDGITFEFGPSNRSSNGTDVSVGQIAGLLFNKSD